MWVWQRENVNEREREPNFVGGMVYFSKYIYRLII